MLMLRNAKLCRQLAGNCMVYLEMNRAIEPFLDTKEPTKKNNDKILEAALMQGNLKS